MTIRSLDCRVQSIGLLGPGLTDWPQARAILRGDQRLETARTVAVLPAVLPPAERRRTGVAVRVAIAAGHEAGTRCPWPISGLASVFSSSGGDGDNCHAICEALASSDRLISPTRFHNSVHNAPSGYWSIAAHATAASTSLCAHDASFGAGLLETIAQVLDTGRPVLYVAYDSPYPEPLRSVRPIPDAFGLAMVLAPVLADDAAKGTTSDIASDAARDAVPGATALAKLHVTLCDEPADTLTDPELESMRTSIPTARALPLLIALARGTEARVVLDYLDASQPGLRVRRLAVTASPV